jgi:pyrroloquinoline quinone biosynthesis protein E
MFNRFRGLDWMQEPCRSCPRKTIDFGGCRCQAFLLTGDSETADPVCHLAPRHAVVSEVVQTVNGDGAHETQANWPEFAYRGLEPIPVNGH